jgi:hypothetical protein
MFARIEMNVINMPREVAFIANPMLPKPSLSKRKIAARIALQRRAGMNQCAAETPFDPPPASRKIRVIRRQGEDGMQVIGENDNRLDCKRALAARKASRNALT